MSASDRFLQTEHETGMQFYYMNVFIVIIYVKKKTSFLEPSGTWLYIFFHDVHDCFPQRFFGCE